VNCLVSLVLAIALQASPEAPAPTVQEIEIRGAKAFDRGAVLGMIRVRPGGPLLREPGVIAEGLAKRYRIAGYPAARVGASFDAASCRPRWDRRFTTKSKASRRRPSPPVLTR